MSSPRFNDEDYYAEFTDRSMVAATGVNKAVFKKLCELANINEYGSPFKSM